MVQLTDQGRVLWPVLLATVILVGAFTCLFLLGHRPAQPNVLWITIDSLRYDHLGCYGYEPAHTPNIDAIANQGVAFSQAIAQASATRYSLPSMVTGRYPLSLSARAMTGELEKGQKTAAQVLEEKGYRTWAIEVPIITATRGFEKVENVRASTSGRTRSCLRALQELQEDNFFIWLYYWDPHAPYQPPAHILELFEPHAAFKTRAPRRNPEDSSLQHISPESKRKAFMESRRKALEEVEKDSQFRDRDGNLRGDLDVLGRINFYGDLVPTQEDRQHLINLYDAEIAFVDEEIEKVVAELHRLALWSQTLVLITADHGEGFGEHDTYYHGLNLYDEVVRVPLIIKPPHSSSRAMQIASQVRNIDIMPTVLDYCGAPISGNIHGISLRPAIEGKALQDQQAYMETYFRERGSIEHLFLGFRTGRHKLIYDLCAGSAELFDLQKDAQEHINLLPAAHDQEIGSPAGPLERQLKEDLLRHLGVESLEQLAQRKLVQKMDQATEERLKALGYIE